MVHENIAKRKSTFFLSENLLAEIREMVLIKRVAIMKCPGERSSTRDYSQC